MEVLIPVLDKFADAFEVSCHYVGTDREKLAEVVRTIRKHTKKPFYMKISPHIPDPAGFAKVIKENGANGVVAINSLGPSMVIDVEHRTMACNNDKGFVWMSGPVVKPLALATVYTIKQAEPSLTVIGVGGVASAKDVIEFLLAGASAVGMLSAPMLRAECHCRISLESLDVAYHLSGILVSVLGSLFHSLEDDLLETVGDIGIDSSRTLGNVVHMHNCDSDRVVAVEGLSA